MTFLRDCQVEEHRGHRVTLLDSLLQLDPFSLTHLGSCSRVAALIGVFGEYPYQLVNPLPAKDLPDVFESHCVKGLGKVSGFFSCLINFILSSGVPKFSEQQRDSMKPLCHLCTWQASVNLLTHRKALRMAGDHSPFIQIREPLLVIQCGNQ